MTAPRRIGASDNSVELHERTLLVTSLAIDDETVVQAARQAGAGGHSLSTWLVACLRAGAVALAAVTTSRDVEELNERVRRTGELMDEAVKRSADQLARVVGHAADPEQGLMALAAKAQINRLSQGIAELVTGRDAVLPNTVRASVASVTDQALAEIQRALASQVLQVQQAVNQDRQALGQGLHAVLNQHTASLSAQFEGLREQLAQAAAPQVRTSAAIGASHEDSVAQNVVALAQAAGDLGYPTGNTTGNDGLKIGDVVVDFANPAGGIPLGRLVVEAKDRSTVLSGIKMMDELRAARSNRGAQAGLLVCASQDCMPNRASILHVLSDSDIAVVWRDGQPTEVLRAAYLLLRLGVTRTSAASGTELDVPELRRRAARAVQHLTGFDRLERTMGTTAKSVASLSEQAAALRRLLNDELDAIAQALAA